MSILLALLECLGLFASLEVGRNRVIFFVKSLPVLLEVLAVEHVVVHVFVAFHDLPVECLVATLLQDRYTRKNRPRVTTLMAQMK